MLRLFSVNKNDIQSTIDVTGKMTRMKLCQNVYRIDCGDGVSLVSVIYDWYVIFWLIIFVLCQWQFMEGLFMSNYSFVKWIITLLTKTLVMTNCGVFTIIHKGSWSGHFANARWNSPLAEDLGLKHGGGLPSTRKKIDYFAIGDLFELSNFLPTNENPTTSSECDGFLLRSGYNRTSFGSISPPDIRSTFISSPKYISM